MKQSHASSDVMLKVLKNDHYSYRDEIYAKQWLDEASEFITFKGDRIIHEHIKV